MESLTATMVMLVKEQRKEKPEMSNDEIHAYIDEVIQDGITMKEISLKDYQTYQANPYMFSLRVINSL